ncbi:hypothetical protein BE21_21575 [Sorangium cellulosum]|uniref:Uncharacterized protein n=1 Tax=Sorangium cellulosum TaxID=56 RepID=A0A150TVV4_SORCE|nr:hypothetical protein BE21_21575 [Sorangium cellulosum]
MRYTPFDLPERITQGASTITFGYDGDQQRVRKTTPEKETLYFGDLYERVTEAASGTVEHRYHVHSPERAVAIVTRGGSDDGTRYVHVDLLGSVDALTNEDGGVIERRSYDPFGQRRNSVWGERPPASFASKTTQGSEDGARSPPPPGAELRWGYAIGRHGADTALAIDRSDYRAADSAGVKAILLGATTCTVREEAWGRSRRGRRLRWTPQEERRCGHTEALVVGTIFRPRTRS